MYYMDAVRAARSATPVFCPNCHSAEREDCSTDERIFAEAARDVPQLIHEGQIRVAREILTALCAIRIANILKPRWLCRTCGARYYD